MPETVVPLFGQTLAGQACEEVVSLLEELLVEAKKGEIIGIAYALIRPNDHGETGGANAQNMSLLAMLGNIRLMEHYYIDRYERRVAHTK